MPKFKVYFEQVNQTKYDIEAKTKQEAIKAAKKLWILDNGTPGGAYVEEDYSDDN